MVDLGVYLTKLKVFFISQGTYDFIIGMDLLEAHQAWVDCYVKRTLCINDEQKLIQIQVIKRKVFLCFISTLQMKHYIE